MTNHGQALLALVTGICDSDAHVRSLLDTIEQMDDELINSELQEIREYAIPIHQPMVNAVFNHYRVQL